MKQEKTKQQIANELISGGINRIVGVVKTMRSEGVGWVGGGDALKTYEYDVMSLRLLQMLYRQHEDVPTIIRNLADLQAMSLYKSVANDIDVPFVVTPEQEAIGTAEVLSWMQRRDESMTMIDAHWILQNAMFWLTWVARSMDGRAELDFWNKAASMSDEEREELLAEFIGDEEE